MPYLWNQILGICPGDKITSPSNPTKCICSEDSIQAFDDKCLMCSEPGAVPNENQTACVGMSNQNFCYIKLQREA